MDEDLVTLRKRINMEEKNKKRDLDELKKKLHELIDNIDDEHTLSVLNDDVVPYVIENRTKEADDEADEAEENLTEEQLKDLDESIAEADRGETISFEEFKKNMEEWRTKLKSTRGSR
jgi:PHD/YefM family antitoxin component YafN of YafNO toxin-antitoxin module